MWYSPAASSARQLRNIGLDRCAAVKGASTVDTPADLSAAAIISLECDGAANQGWTYDAATQTIRNERSGRCLNILIYSNPDTNPPAIRQIGQYALFVQGACTDANAKWTFDGTAIKDYKGRCLEITGGSTAIGTLIQVNPTCDGSAKQQWSYEPLSDRLNHPTTAHRILNDVFGNCVDVLNTAYDPADSGHTTNGVALEGFPCFGGQVRPTQNWYLNGNGRIVNQGQNSACLDGRSGVAGESLRLLKCNLGAQQQWTFDTTSRQLRNLEKGMCVQGSFDASPPTLQVCNTNSSEQRWNIESATGAQDRRIVRQLRSTQDNYCLEVASVLPGHDTQAETFPCLGTSRPAQAYLLLNVAYNVGQLRPVTAPATDPLCIESWSVGGGVHTQTCKPGTQDETSRRRWHIRVLNATREAFAVAPGTNNQVDRIRNFRYDTGCIQNLGGLAQAGLRTCGTGTDQGWVIEPVQAHPYSNEFHGQVRNVGTNSCMEPWNKDANSDIVSWPCAGSSRPQQELILLATGQIRMTNGSRCLDWEDSGNNGKTRALWWGCGSGANQKWTRDGNLIRSQLNPAKCLQGALDSETVQVLNCNAGEPLQLNRPGLVGGSRPLKRGWSHAEGFEAGEADDASVLRG